MVAPLGQVTSPASASANHEKSEPKGSLYLSVATAPNVESKTWLFGTYALATTTSGLGNLLANLDGGLHVMTTALELAEGPLCCHLALEVLDGTLDSSVSNLHLERPALH